MQYLVKGAGNEVNSLHGDKRRCFLGVTIFFGGRENYIGKQIYNF